MPNSIFLTPETEVGWELSVAELQQKFGYDATTSEGKAFDTRKDISTPPFMDLSHVLNL